ncbi:hypothetical protein MKW98_003074 [Papaver atlanticum]|uniref:Uncharacterized protein n=1 Tax=Papaver atlanticum TaxID=357466 RepID=A0AAD4TEN8_9MAGN|nr:hypothetical protein MKW98_003074 [Papaver atlanticum]
MDNSRNSINWTHNYYYQGKNMEELRHSLLYTTLELESTRLAAQEEIIRREEQVTHLKDLLNRTIKERDEAEEKCQSLLIDKLLLQQQQQTANYVTGISSIEDEPKRGGDSCTGISSSDCEESIVSSPVVMMMDTIPLPNIQLTPEKPLPEKGKFLQAVMKAGPLLQTLLLAGPLPQWRHPPPPLIEIPLVGVAIPSPSQPQPQPELGINNQSCGTLNKRKRSLMFCEGSDSSINSHKYQRVLLN